MEIDKIKRARQLGNKENNNHGGLLLNKIKDFNDDELMAFTKAYAAKNVKNRKQYIIDKYNFFKDYIENNTDDVVKLSVYTYRDGIRVISEKVYNILVSIKETGKLSLKEIAKELTKEEKYQFTSSYTENHTGRCVIMNDLIRLGMNEKVTELLDKEKYKKGNAYYWGGGVTLEELEGLTKEEVEYVCQYLLDCTWEKKPKEIKKILKQLNLS